MPKHKPRPRPEPADAWTWLYRLTAAEGIDLQHTSLAEAADCVVSRLEAQRDAGLSLSPETVRLAALLVRVEAEVIASGASSPEPFLQHAHLRAWTRLLAERYAANRRVWSRPPIQKPRPQPKPQPEPMVTVFDLVQQMRFLVQLYAPHLLANEAKPSPASEPIASPE